MPHQKTDPVRAVPAAIYLLNLCLRPLSGATVVGQILTRHRSVEHSDAGDGGRRSRRVHELAFRRNVAPNTIMLLCVLVNSGLNVTVEASSEQRQVAIALDPVEALLGLGHAGRRPAQRHLAGAAALDVAGDVSPRSIMLSIGLVERRVRVRVELS